MIRFATEQDVDALVALGARAHAESPRYRDLPFDAGHTEDFARAAIDHKWSAVLVAEEDGQLVGVFIGTVIPHYFSTTRIGSNLVLYVAPERRGSFLGVKLVRAWDEVLSADGRVTESCLGLSAEVDTVRTRQMFTKRLGYRDAGYLMVKNV